MFAQTFVEYGELSRVGSAMALFMASVGDRVYNAPPQMQAAGAIWMVMLWVLLRK